MLPATPADCTVNSANFSTNFFWVMLCCSQQMILKTLQSEQICRKFYTVFQRGRNFNHLISCQKHTLPLWILRQNSTACQRRNTIWAVHTRAFHRTYRILLHQEWCVLLPIKAWFHYGTLSYATLHKLSVFSLQKFPLRSAGKLSNSQTRNSM